jgi:lipoyl-dependent peroxiredoxin
MFKRTSTANWKGSGLEGSGTLSMQSGVFEDQPYSFKTRFQSEDGKAGTNPEELLAASHAGCFAMALSFLLSGAGHPPENLEVSAVITMKSEGVHWSVAGIELKLEAKVPGIDAAKFQELAEQAKSGCPISKALSAVPIALDAKLV